MNSIQKFSINLTCTAILLAAVLLSACGGGASSSSLTVTPRIAAGVTHTVGLKSDGSLWIWGDNSYGQFGDGYTLSSSMPIPIGTGYKAIAAGAGHTLAIKQDGSLWAWGMNYGAATRSLAPKQIGTGYSSIASATTHAVALKSDGSLWTWGNNSYGQLGDGTTSDSLVPEQIGTGYSAITAGDGYTVALKSDGSLWAWGVNSSGQLGDGTTINNHVPKQIGNGYTAIAAGEGHTVALKSDGSLWAWGWNLTGQLGDGTTTGSLVPKQIGTGYTAITAGWGHTVALKSDGSLWAWGNNRQGQLGDGTTATDSLAPKQIDVGYIAIAANGSNTFALKSDGSLWAWGDNSYGQLGDSTTVNSLVPKPIGTGYTVSNTVAPNSLAGLIAVPAGANQVNLFWSASADQAGVTSYKVYRNGTLAGITAITNYSDSGLTASAAYNYTVSACDVSGNCSAPDMTASVTTLAPRDIHVPTVPVLTATAVSATQIDLAWTPATDSVGVTQYKIWRTDYNNCVSTSNTACAAWVSAKFFLTTLSGMPPTTSYSDTGLPPSTKHSYTVQACNAAGNCSVESATVSATTLLHQ